MSVDSFIRQNRQQAVSSVLQGVSSIASIGASEYKRVQAEKDSLQTKFQEDYLSFCQQLPYSLDTDQYSQASENWINDWTANVYEDTNYSNSTRQWVQNEFSTAQKQGSTKKITGIANIANNTRTATLISAKADMLRTDPNVSYENAVAEFTKSFNDVQGSSLVGTYNIQTPEVFKEAIKYDKASQSVSSLVRANYTGEDLDSVGIVKKATQSIPDYKASPIDTINLQAQVGAEIEKMDKVYQAQASAINNDLKSQYQSAIFSNNIVDMTSAIEKVYSVPEKYRLGVLTTLNDLQDHNNEIALNSFSKQLDSGYGLTDESLSIINDPEKIDELVTKELVILGKGRFSSSSSVQSTMDFIDSFSDKNLTISPSQREEAKSQLLQEIQETTKDLSSIQEMDMSNYINTSTAEKVAEEIAPKDPTKAITFRFGNVFTPDTSSFVTEAEAEQTSQAQTQTEQTEEIPIETEAQYTPTTTPTEKTQTTETPQKTTTTKEPTSNYVSNLSKEEILQRKQDAMARGVSTTTETTTPTPLSPIIPDADKFSTASPTSVTDPILKNILTYRVTPGATESNLQNLVLKAVNQGLLPEDQAESLSSLPNFQGVSAQRANDIDTMIDTISKDLISSKNLTSRENLQADLKVFFSKQIAENPKLLSDDSQYSVFTNKLESLAVDSTASNLLEEAQVKGEALENPKKYIEALATADADTVMDNIVNGNFNCFVDNTLQQAYGTSVPKKLRSTLYTDENLRDYYATNMGFSTTDYSYLNDENDPTMIKRLMVEYNVLYAKTKRAIAQAFADTFNDLTPSLKKDVEDFNIMQYSGGFYIQDPEVPQLWWKPNQEAFDDKGITNWNYAVADSATKPSSFIVEGNFGQFDSQLAEDIMSLESHTYKSKGTESTGTESRSKQGFFNTLVSDMSWQASTKQQAVSDVMFGIPKEKKEATRDQLIRKIFNLRMSLVPPSTSGGTTRSMLAK